jgi:hypothetical protein
MNKTQIYIRYLAFIKAQWERFGAYAWQSYRLHGPGAVMCELNAPMDIFRFWIPDPTSPTGERPIRGGYVRFDQIKYSISDEVKIYSPPLEILIGIENRYANECFFITLSSPNDPAPCECEWLAGQIEEESNQWGSIF